MEPVDIRHEIKRARAGDRAALDRLLTRTQDRITALAQARMGPGLRGRIHTSDLIQSTFLEIVGAVGGFEGETEEAFVGWFGRILENNIRDKKRYFDAEKRAGRGGAGEELHEGSVRDQGPSPSAQAAFGEEIVVMSRAFGHLSDDYRRIIQLRVVEGRPHHEAAALMNRAESATRVLLSRARAALLLEADRLRRN